MKKIVVLMMAAMSTVLVSAVMADEMGGERAGRLFLFQKCDDTLIGKSGYDSSGCPNVGTGPWPTFAGKDRAGVLHYSLWGKKFEFFFQGRNLLPDKNYTLVYYPDGWPGSGLICLGSGKTNPVKSANQQNYGNKHGGNKHPGNIEIHGSLDIGTGLPAPYDKNYNPVSPSGAVGAKIWLVLSDDVKCSATVLPYSGNQMTGWNPTAYLFEYNLIVYENREVGEDVDEE